MIHLLRHNKEIEAYSGHDNILRQLTCNSLSYCLLSTGRMCVQHLIFTLGLKKGSIVYLPTYVAEGVIKPFLVNHIQVIFYHLDEHLSPDIQYLCEIVKECKTPTLFIYINYFGFNYRKREFYKLLRSKNILILEDNAHCLFPIPFENDLTPDFELYSFNKFLPVCDGALLVSKNSLYDVSLDENRLEKLDDEAIHSYNRHLSINAEIYSNADSKFCLKLLEETAAVYEDYYKVINYNYLPKRSHELSNSFLRNMNFSYLKDKRVENFQILNSHLRQKIFYFPFEKINCSTTVPFAVPIYLKGRFSREELSNKLLKRGIFFAILEDKWNFIPKTYSNEFKYEFSFINRHLLIPINEFISKHEMLFICKSLNTLQNGLE